MIKLRMDVDYAYPSRLQSFLFTILNKKVSSNYLKNSKILAKMINESPEEVRAYWFFTPHTIPDKEMLGLMRPDKHEVALHVANHPYAELERLREVTKRKVDFYTVHGTARLFARLMWRRKLWESRAQIPSGFPLKNFWDFPTLSLDLVCYANSVAKALKIAEESVEEGKVLHIHPEWLFQRGKLNHRGPYYEVLKTLLHTDTDLEGLTIHKKGFAKLASYSGTKEYERDFIPTDKFTEKLAERGADIFTFIERKWSRSISNPSPNWLKTEENIGMLQVTTYSAWWESIGKKTRNMVRKAEKNGITTAVVEPSLKVADSIWKIYNETPIRQGRGFPYFGIPFFYVKAAVFSEQKSTFVCAFLQDELVGFIQLAHGDNIAIISQILSLQKYWDKAVNNALVAKAIEFCSEKKIQWVMYGRMGNHPSLDSFKESNCFTKLALTRYYVPLTKKGQIAIKLGRHRELKDTLPALIKTPLFPFYNWVSRTKMKVRLMRRSSRDA
jgi:hypothetical protein